MLDAWFLQLLLLGHLLNLTRLTAWWYALWCWGLKIMSENSAHRELKTKRPGHLPLTVCGPSAGKRWAHRKEEDQGLS